MPMLKQQQGFTHSSSNTAHLSSPSVSRGGGGGSSQVSGGRSGLGIGVGVGGNNGHHMKYVPIGNFFTESRDWFLLEFSSVLSEGSSKEAQIAFFEFATAAFTSQPSLVCSWVSPLFFFFIYLSVSLFLCFSVSLFLCLSASLFLCVSVSLLPYMRYNNCIR